MAIPTPPAAPNPLGTNFAAEALAFTQWMHTAAPEFNTAVTDANAAVGDAEQAVLDAAAQVGLATTQAGNASSSASTASGHAIAADNARAAAVLAKDAAEDARDMSQTYAALAGASAGLPALAGQALKQLQVKVDESGVQWVVPVAGAANIVRAEKTSAYTLTSADKGALIDCAGTWTLGADAAATLGAGWWCYVRNAGAEAITLDPNAAEQIDGQATISLMPGYTLLVQCDGTTLTTLTLKRRTYDSRRLITATEAFVVPADTYVIRGYAFGAGAAGTTTNSGGGGGCAYGDIAVTPGESLSVAIASGVAKVSRGATDLLTGSPASGTTAGTASKHASVQSGGAYSGGGGGGSNRGGGSSGSPLGQGVNSGGSGGGSGWGGAGVVGGGGIGGGAGADAAGPGLPQHIPITEPLLFGCTAPGAAVGASGGPGAGGGATATTGFRQGGAGGFGGGGGAATATTGFSAAGGAGGFGGGGGAGIKSVGSSGSGGAGGFGGGGGFGTDEGGAGGPAAVILIY